MTNYRRIYVPRGTYFFTINLQDRRSDLLTKEIIHLRAAFSKVKQKQNFHIDAISILPDHLHCVLTFDQAADYFKVIRLIKTHFTKCLSNNELVTSSKKQRVERGVWQRRYWAHLITDEDDYKRHVEYCYINPLKHGYVERVRDWAYSSFHRDVKRGLFPNNWAGTCYIRGETNNFGER